MCGGRRQRRVSEVPRVAPRDITVAVQTHKGLLVQVQRSQRAVARRGDERVARSHAQRRHVRGVELVGEELDVPAAAAVLTAGVRVGVTAATATCIPYADVAQLVT